MPEGARRSPRRDMGARPWIPQAQSEIRHHGCPPGRRSVPDRGLARPRCSVPSVKSATAFSRRGGEAVPASGWRADPSTPFCGFFVRPMDRRLLQIRSFSSAGSAARYRKPGRVASLRRKFANGSWSPGIASALTASTICGGVSGVAGGSVGLALRDSGASGWVLRN